ncbi:3-phosphoshikimate 1-carboxyvinyltransferase [Syntrophobotulus glycolicus DSM 8271]|uniref:3-phosphoshikimate 1-carboxyvinyltransferase n=1 Tax=Syntrophobotulus glycolicus (strain DSM 8271 / FlGlyR) TaxID=645991 RepID=F0SUU3_SYNGF|nr:3-phosphoshikimate 1-carboxyvinyltransferase [Syntrophobotulus glycolicus]ADY56659.1 3-phosphoshikimate 1-carboxyvinyltransferase [Syntrophobotulus glycolicus DSM 8271]
MASMTILPGILKGSVIVPPSKSISHRALICAALAEGTSNIGNFMISDDMMATMNGLRALGAGIEAEEQGAEGIHLLRITGIGANLFQEGGEKNHLEEDRLIDCQESGSTLRFLLPLAGLKNSWVTFTGRGRLVSRPLDVYFRLFDEHGVSFEKQGNSSLPLKVNGLLQPGEYRVEGDISSQFISGLMFLLPLLASDSRIVITSKLESKGYLDLTMDMLSRFSIKIENNHDKEFIIKGNQRYQKQDTDIEGDYSQVAFWLAAGLLGGEIDCLNMNSQSLQGDREIVNILQGMGGRITAGQKSIRARASLTKGTVIDGSQCPDIIPVLAALAAVSEGETRIINAERLRIKESDRLKAISTELNKLGAKVEETADGLDILGCKNLHGGPVSSWNDHRIAMALAVAACRCTEPVLIEGSDAVSKSYPHFWEDYRKLGGRIDG